VVVEDWNADNFDHARSLPERASMMRCRR